MSYKLTITHYYSITDILSMKNNEHVIQFTFMLYNGIETTRYTYSLEVYYKIFFDALQYTINCISPVNKLQIEERLHYFKVTSNPLN